jgi:ATP-GRASP peptide maturase of grasp-with-spasm system
MILILTGEDDVSSDLVIEWLDYFNHDYVRINSLDFLYKNIEITQENGVISIKINTQIINIDDIKVVWYRKFGVSGDSDFFHEVYNTFNQNISRQLLKEFSKVLNYVNLIFKDKYWLTDPVNVSLNKLEVLKIASICGFSTPYSKLLNNKKDIDPKCDFIVKSICDSTILCVAERNFTMYTNIITPEDIKHIPSTFFPSLIQEKIEKEYEVRVFYLDKKCYSMAIFSQKDTQTKIDFRRYNWKCPNRSVPYKLPKQECVKIVKLMKMLGLNCGSIDLIKSTDGKYYFLEVNPTGQFGMVDFPCNYGLHKKVAEILVKLDV